MADELSSSARGGEEIRRCRGGPRLGSGRLVAGASAKWRPSVRYPNAPTRSPARLGGRDDEYIGWMRTLGNFGPSVSLVSTPGLLRQTAGLISKPWPVGNVQITTPSSRATPSMARRCSSRPRCA
jgi:fermentation-respiration switch protein FrsA (DUF1100 family)